MAIETFDDYLGSYIGDAKLGEFLKLLASMSPNIVREFPHKLDQKAIAQNKFGEATKELDAWTNEYFTDTFISSGLVRELYSEEIWEPVQGRKGAPFTVAIDPLDGSSNIVSNNPFGTIIGVYRDNLPVAGRKLVCAIYKLYGPITTLVLATEKGVAEFVKNRKGEGHYLALNTDLRLPKEPKVFGMGGRPTDWEPGFYSFIKHLAKERKMKLRYCGALVGDFSQVLHYGGFFAYPALQKEPMGKLRLYLECATMAYVMEKAGGASSNGEKSILDVVGGDPYVRTPFYIGNKELVKELEHRLKR